MLRVALGRTVTRRAAAIGGGVTLLGAGAYAASSSEATLGVRRQGQFWSRVFPVVFDYYWHFASSSPHVKFRKWMLGDKNDEKEQKQLRKEILDQLHQRHAPEILQVMLDLKGLYVKLGQVLSVSVLPIPDPYRKLFRTLQSDVPGWEDFDKVVKPVLEKEFGRNLDEIFTFIEPVPCGAASIGQAHRAKLVESGADVIIKVQYPDAAWQVPADIKCVGDLLAICVWTGVVDESASRLSFQEFSRQFLAELDYKEERRNLEQIYQSSIVPNSPYQKRGVVVPNVYEDLCTKLVITMTYLPGPKLEQEARRQLELLGVDTSKGIGSLVRDAARENSDPTNQSDDNTVVSTDTKSAKPSWKMTASKFLGQVVGVDSILWAVRVTRRLMLLSTAAAVATIRVASPVLPHDWETWADAHQTAAQQAARLALTESWIDALFDVHGHQIFNLGLFNADPHPGNILVLDEEDESPSTRLGLIDFGQCKRLTPQEQVGIAQLILSVANEESDELVASAFRGLDIQTKNNSTEFLASFARLMFGPLQPQHMDHAFHNKLHGMDSVVYFPKELSMVYRTSLLLRGLALSLQVNSSISEKWRHHAQAAIDRHTQEAPHKQLTTVQDPIQQVVLGSQLLVAS